MQFLLDDISESTLTMFRIAGSLLLYLICFVVPLAALAALMHTLLSLPLRRRERARSWAYGRHSFSRSAPG